VLLQHRDLDDRELEDLSQLAGDGVAVVPNDELPERIVATAWLFKQTCSAVDVEVLEGFVDAHRGDGPGANG
jgi:hypothetical protein